MIYYTKISCGGTLNPLVVAWKKNKRGRIKDMKILLNEKDFSNVPQITQMKIEAYMNSLHRLWKFGAIKTENDLTIFSNKFVCEQSPKFFFWRKKMFRSKLYKYSSVIKDLLWELKEYENIDDLYFVQKFKKEKKELLKSMGGKKPTLGT